MPGLTMKRAPAFGLFELTHAEDVACSDRSTGTSAATRLIASRPTLERKVISSVVSPPATRPLPAALHLPAAPA